MAAGLASPLGHVGLALATSTAATVNALTLAWLLRRRFGGGPLPGARRAWARTALAALALLGGLYLLSAWWPAPVDRLAEAGWLLVTITASVLAYAALHAALGGEEPRLAWALGRRVLGRALLRRSAAR
jgi:peptidoglycan biosynthesis protein MviN/MurJ (putative lipid II flippase)